MHNTHSVYHERLHTLSNKLAKLKRNSKQMGWVRLFVFLLIIAVMIWVVAPLASPIVFMISVILGIGIFLLPLSFHQKILNSIAFHEALIMVNANEIVRKENLFSDGAAYTGDSFLATDIDITGKGSLYELINRSVTPYGNTALLNNLIGNNPTPTWIQKIQQALQELTPEIDLRQDLIALALLGFSEKQERFTWSGKLYFNNRQWKVLLALWPLLAAIAIGGGIFVHGIFYVVPLLSWLILKAQSKNVQQLYYEIRGTHAMWSSYAKLFNRFDAHVFKSETLIELKNITHGASAAIQQLAKISSRWDHRENGLAVGVMNTLTLFDIKCAYDYEQWKRYHENKLSAWLDALGHLEMLNSLATFAFNHPTYTFPTLKSGKLEVDIQNMGHPLVASSAIITNNIKLGADGKVYIITGSNMSGKSTFLRGVGLNMILAQAGAPVFASAMTFTPLRIHTSFRQRDSVQESTSYFMAELKRLKEIMTAVDEPEGSLVLLDEILRGTNSEDKSHGSEVLIEKLLDKNAITLLATHDLKLGSLEAKHPSRVVNYCFESEINGNTLAFDYTIRRGIAKNKNATFLMKQMGIA